MCGFYNYFSANNPYAGGGTFGIKNNPNFIPNPTTIQDIIDAGACPFVPEPMEAKPVPGLGQWGLWLLILSLMMVAWRHEKRVHSGK
jgi:hypothetical protein